MFIALLFICCANAALQLASTWPSVPVSATVVFNAVAPTGNFGAPSPDAQVGYTIKVLEDASYFNLLFTTTTTGGLDFANLYFGNSAAPPTLGSFLGMETSYNGGTTITRFFVPGGAGTFTAPAYNPIINTNGASVADDRLRVRSAHSLDSFR